ncbi:MAG: hypothetical protein ACKO5Q_05255, partial [Microcystaceae cyanobacterium]
MTSWWVNQGSNFKEELEWGYLWSPVHGKDGRKVASWDTMREIKTGDIVFHYYKGSIRAYSHVIEEAPKELKSRPNQDDSTEG